MILIYFGFDYTRDPVARRMSLCGEMFKLKFVFVRAHLEGLEMVRLQSDVSSSQTLFEPSNWP